MQLLRASSLSAIVFIAHVAAAADPPAKDSLPKITIDKETTSITKPLRGDGYPDYVAALNERMREGVTLENNSAVLLQKAFGPKEIPAELREGYFKLLGIPVPPERGDYIVDEAQIITRWRVDHQRPAGEEDDGKLWDEFDAAETRPWSATEFPMAASWLTANEKPLAIALEASRRPRQYFPTIIRADAPLIANLLPQIGQLRGLARLLAAQAMFDLGRGDADKAWQNLLACRRLARLTAETDGSLVNTLVAYAINGLADTADLTFLHHAKLSTDQIKAMRAELNALSPIKGPADVLNIGERFMFLDVTLHTARQGPNALDALRSLATGGSARQKDKPSDLQPDVANLIDWNDPLRTGNKWYDRMSAAARIANHSERQRAIEKIESDLAELGGGKQRTKLLIDFFSKTNPQELITPRVTNALLALILPATTAIVTAHERVELFSRMNDAAFALAEYRADHKQYPDTLAELVPKYLKEIPEDIFKKSPGTIGYRRDGDAYLFWTVGRDGIDSNGRSSEEDELSDDLVLRPALLKKSGK